MLESLLFRGLVGSLVLFSSYPAYSQTLSSVPQSLLAQAASPTQVTPEELEKFAQALKQLILIEREANQRMAQAVQEEGLTPERFVQIEQSTQGEGAASAADISAEEKQKYDKALVKVREIVQEVRAKQYQALQSQGLEVERFQEIVAVVQNNPQLEQQVQQMLQN